MKNLSKLAVLGAALAAFGPFASATSFTGSITVQDAPSGDLGSSDSTFFDLSSVFTGTTATGVAEPNVPTGSTNLVSYITTPTLYTFTTGAINSSGATGVELYSGTNSADTQSASFYATSYDALTEDGNGDYDLTAYGYFTDLSGNHTAGFDNIVFDSGTTNTTADTSNGSVSEILTATAATPEPSSLLLLGTGLASAAGMMLRKARTVVA
jgi:hypothetical protein